MNRTADVDPGSIRHRVSPTRTYRDGDGPHSDSHPRHQPARSASPGTAGPTRVRRRTTGPIEPGLLTFTDAQDLRDAILDRALQDPSLTYADFRTLVVVITKTLKWRTPAAATSRAVLAKGARCNERTVTRAMRRLEDRGYLDWTAGRGGGTTCLSTPSEVTLSVGTPVVTADTPAAAVKVPAGHSGVPLARPPRSGASGTEVVPPRARSNAQDQDQELTPHEVRSSAAVPLPVVAAATPGGKFFDVDQDEPAPTAAGLTADVGGRQLEELLDCLPAEFVRRLGPRRSWWPRAVAALARTAQGRSGPVIAAVLNKNLKPEHLDRIINPGGILVSRLETLAPPPVSGGVRPVRRVDRIAACPRCDEDGWIRDVEPVERCGHSAGAPVGRPPIPDQLLSTPSPAGVPTSPGHLAARAFVSGRAAASRTRTAAALPVLPPRQRPAEDPPARAEAAA